MRAWAVLTLALIAGPVSAAVDVDLQRYADAARSGAAAVVSGRAYAERRTPDSPDTPLAGTTIVAMPWSEGVARRLEQLREGARASAAAYRDAASLMQKAREDYERALWDAGAADLVLTAVVDAAGRFNLGPLPEGRWLVLGTSDHFHEVQGPKAARGDGAMYAPRRRLVGYRSRLVWLREVAVTPARPAELELTDRNVWFTGVVEERMLDPARRR